MDIFEFELRYRAYDGLLQFFGEKKDEKQLLSYIQRTDAGTLPTKLTETSIEQLRDVTRLTYTDQKKEILKHLATQTHKNRSKADYLERLEYELKVIYEMGYNTYFLVVRDYIHRARSSKIMVGPGRGSVAGSLLSCVLGITDLDPLDYDLIFERFLNPGRISMPDIDSDFEDTERERVIEYIKDRYGRANVAHIGTYMSLAAKAAFKDVARVMGMKFDQANKLSMLVTEKTISESIEKNKELAELIKNDARVEKIITTARALEGTVRQTGVHACGMIIAPQSVDHYSAIQYPPKAGSRELRDESRIVSQYEGPIVESIGLLKMDILGLRNLNIIKHTAKIIKARAKRAQIELPELVDGILETMTFHPPLDDPQAYAIFSAGDTSGIFQFESDGMTTWLKKLKPNCFDDLIAMVALYRPGPMEFIPHYIDRKHGDQQISYIQPDLEQKLLDKYGKDVLEAEKTKLIEDLSPFMSITYGIAVYQEQLMRLVQAMAGFSMAEADNLRKGVGKKIREVIEKIKVEFVKRSVSYREYKPETASRIYEKMIEPAADYSFNKSHAACYAYISYQTAWLKAHYPLEFHAALLRSVEEDPEKMASVISEIQLQGIVIRAPHLNTAFEHVGAIEDHLEIGFLGIKGIGTEVAQHLEKERETNGPFSSLTDFLRRMKEFVNKKTLESLIKAGTLDEFGDRGQLYGAIPAMLERVKHQAVAGGGLFGGGFFGEQEFPLPEIKEPLGLIEKLRMEKEVFNIAVSGHPLDGLARYYKSRFTTVATMNVENSGPFRICIMINKISKGMRGGFFLQGEDMTGAIEFYFSDKIDVEPYDIAIISGYKGARFPKADAIRIISRSGLIEKAKKAGLYDADQTVAKIRATRKKSGQLTPLPSAKKEAFTTELPIEDISPSTETEHTPLPSETNGADESLEIADPSSPDFPLPDDITLLTQLSEIIKNHPGQKPVTIGTMHVLVSEDGYEKVMNLLR